MCIIYYTRISYYVHIARIGTNITEKKIEFQVPSYVKIYIIYNILL